MPNVNPRLQVILPRDVHATIVRLARVQGRSSSAVARDFLTEAAPILARVAATLEAAQAMDTKGRARFKRSLEAAQAQIEIQADRATETMDRSFTPIVEAAGVRRRRTRGPAGRRKTPVQ